MGFDGALQSFRYHCSAANVTVRNRPLLELASRSEYAIAQVVSVSVRYSHYAVGLFLGCVVFPGLRWAGDSLVFPVRHLSSSLAFL
jgi:hypothetical protein